MNKFLVPPRPDADIQALRGHAGPTRRRRAAGARAHPAAPPPVAPPPLPAPSASPAAPAHRQAPATARQWRAGDVARHLDMAVIGDVCIGIGLAGYRKLLSHFLADPAGSHAGLLAALAQAERGAVRERAHALKGASASLGLRALQAAAAQLEAAGDALPDAACAEAAVELRALLETARGLLQRMGLL